MLAAAAYAAAVSTAAAAEDTAVAADTVAAVQTVVASSFVVEIEPRRRCTDDDAGGRLGAASACCMCAGVPSLDTGLHRQASVHTMSDSHRSPVQKQLKLTTCSR